MPDTDCTRYGRNGTHDVSVLRGDEVVAEFRGRSTGTRSEESQP